MLPSTLNELTEDLNKRIAMAEAADNKYFFIETWELKSILTGDFFKPDDVESTEEDRLFDDTGELSKSQMAALVQRDCGEMPTKQCKAVEQ